MDNFEEKFLEELAKAKARLEGKESYDDEAIEKEFIPDETPIKAETDNSKKPKAAKPAAVKKEKPAEIKTETSVSPATKATETKKAKKKVSSEKPAVIFGFAALIISFVSSCLGLIINNNSPLWQTFDSYMPFVCLVLGAASVIWGALLIKNNKKGTLTLVLGILAMFVSIFISAINF